MQSIGKLVASQASYYTDQLTHSVGEDTPVQRSLADGQVDYYTAHESPSRWMGSGLERIGLQPGSQVDKDLFAQLMNHHTPDGESMTRQFAGHGKVAAFDHTFSAPKSVSILFAFGEEAVRDTVVRAHRTAVESALDYMQTNCSQSRLATKTRDDEGRWKVNTKTIDSEGYVAAGFDHFTSRADDPQVHTHVVVINRVWAEEGWRTIDAKRAYAHAKAGGTIYQASLRDQLTASLGVTWQPVVNGMADISGISPELIHHFSARRIEIEAAVDRYLAQHGGEAHRRVWQTFTLETRQAKTYSQGETAVARRMKDYGVTGTVESHWYQKAIDAPEDVIAAVDRVVTTGRHGIRPTHKQIAESAKTITEWVTDRQPVFTERDLVASVAALYPEGAASQEMLDATRTLLHAAQHNGDVLTILPTGTGDLNLPDGVALTPEESDLITDTHPGWVSHTAGVRFRALPGEARYTTRLQLEREHQVLAAVDSPSPVTIDPEALDAAITGRELVGPQAGAVSHLATSSGRLVTVVGPGGSGKTYSIGAYTDAARTQGSHVIGVATSAAAARQLGEQLGPETWTGTIAMLRHHHDATNRPWPGGTIVVTDEASMVSTADLAWLVQAVDDCDGRLILLGDPKQLPSIDSGGLFHRIVETGNGVVTDLADLNQRQTLDLDRSTLQRLRAGEIRAAVYDYHEAGRLHLGHDEYATKAAMVDAWWADALSHGVDQVRMLASRHDEVWMLNQLARVHMTTTGRLTGPTITNRWGLHFQRGDRVVVRDNWYAHSDLRNGQTGTITQVDPTDRTVTFRRDLDFVEITLPKRYVDANLDHAYAQTIHTAQGQTFHTTHLYADPGLSAEHGYTALSRARDETHLWLNHASGPLGQCTHIHGQPLEEDQIEALIRRLTQSVIEAPATDQGIAIRTATDRQLIEWRDQLAQTITASPLMWDANDQLVALDGAIEETRQLAQRHGSSGIRNQLALLETQRDALADQETVREVWLEENGHVVRNYSAVVDEIGHRIQARVAMYAVEPPEDLIATIGHRPDDPAKSRQWDAQAAAYADARIINGEASDLLDPSLHSSLRWREVALPAVATQPELVRRLG